MTKKPKGGGTSIKPLADRVLLQRIEDKDQKRGGIFIPDTAKEKPMKAKVIAVGAGRMERGKRIPPEVKAGNQVLVGKYAGTEIKLDDRDHVIVKEDEILGIVS